MDALTMPEQKRPARNSRRHIPAELVEEILLNLPMESLLRFSTVSKSWNSMIFRSEFATRYCGREMMVLKPYSDDDDDKALVCHLSSISSHNPTDNATPFIRPLKADSYLHASCDQLWCVEFENSLCLYNPSMRTYRKLPTPLGLPQIGSSIAGSSISVFVYGLGYDSVANDYKILKTHRDFYGETELYSLRSDSWRKVSDSWRELTFLSSKGLFVGGALHWMVLHHRIDENGKIVPNSDILSFDLSKEKYGKLALPELPESVCKKNCVSHHLDVTVLRGMLCVYMNHSNHTRFVVWAMEDYGMSKWTKELEINYGHIHPVCYSYLKPFYFSDSSGNLMKAVTSSTEIRKIFLYKDGSTLVEKNFGSNGCGIIDSFTYIESFVSPWPGSVPSAGGSSRKSDDERAMIVVE